MERATNFVALAFIFAIGLTQLQAQPRRAGETGNVADPFGAPADARIEATPLEFPSEAPAVKVPRKAPIVKIEEELAKPTTLDVVEMPLRDVITVLQDQHQFPIVMKLKQLSEANVPTDAIITKCLRGVTLATALHLVLDDLGLGYYVDEVLVITTEADAQAHPEVRIYDCRDVLAGNERTKRLSADARTQQLMKLITTNIDPQRWAPASSVGGTISEFDGFIVVTQTAQTHAKVANLLNMYRKAAGFDVPKTASAAR